MHPRTFLTTVIVLAATGVLHVSDRAGAATITVAHSAGHGDVLINGYRTPALGTFTLRDGDADQVALCIEADDAHTTAAGAYTAVPNELVSPELDALLWILADVAQLDDGTATAAAALAWFYAGARRDIGPPVWGDGSRGFAPITPLAPEPWDALEAYSLGHPVGLRSGDRELDSVERRVAELHRLATALSGPWALTADATRLGMRLTGAAGPVAGRTVTFTVEPLGSSPLTLTAVTDGDGWAVPELPPLADGAHVMAGVDGPGVHREWDGPTAIQRMVTATSMRSTATFDIPRLPRHIELRKRSSEPTIAVAGAEFALLDAGGATVATATTDEAGSARFAAFDAGAHPGPYVVRELRSPPGLALADDVAVHGAISHDPARPTLVEVVDEALRVPLRVEKQLSAATASDDLSGFVFAVQRLEGGFDDELVTGADGTTDELLLPLGSYRICEQAVPAWATDHTDGGCQTIVIDLERLAGAAPITVDYLNIVPTTTSTTTSTTTTSTPPSTSTTSTSIPTMSTTSTTPTTAPSPATTLPPPPVTVAASPSSLPPTGSQATAGLLRIADLGFVTGVALVALTGLLPARIRTGRAVGEIRRAG